MANLIYLLNIFLFLSQFKLTKRELLKLPRLNVFVVKVYLMTWFTCQSPTSVPQNDLSMLRNIKACKNFDASVALTAMRRFSKHLWYLSETLAFFDTDVTVGEKVEMVRALQRQAPSDDPPPPPYRMTFEENKTG